VRILKPKKVPSKLIKVLYMCYKWGYSDKENDVPLRTQEDLEEQVNRGYKKGLEKQKA
jgi:hypothetical protein